MGRSLAGRRRGVLHAYEQQSPRRQGSAGGGSGQPRSDNVFGHSVRWREEARDATALAFAWDIFAECGDPAHADASKRGTVKGDPYGSPDGLWFDPRGLLWIQTDVSTSVLGRGDYANVGNNAMLAADARTGETRRFLVGPRAARSPALR